VRRGTHPDIVFWSFLLPDGDKSNKFVFWKAGMGVYQITFRIKLPSLPLFSQMLLFVLVNVILIDWLL